MPVRTKDGWISFTVNTDPQVRAFLNATDRSELLNDARFTSVAARAKYVSEWFEVRGAPLTNKSTEEWLSLLQAADIAAQPCHSLESLQQDRHLAAVGLISYEQHPTEGRVAAIRSSIRIDDETLKLREPSQPKGWESKKILSEVGYTNEQIERMQSCGAVLAAQAT